MPAVTIADLNNGKIDLDKWRDIVQSTGATVTLRNGQVVPTRKALFDGLSAAAAITETGQNKAAAQDARDEAEDLRDETVLLRDAAMVGAGPVYATEAAGRAAVADGAVFKVQGSGTVAVVEYRRVNSGSSTLIASYPSVAAVNGIAPVAKSVAAYGTLPGGVASPNSYTAGAPTISPLVHTYLNGLGAAFAYTHATLASLQESYFRVDAPRKLRQGAWVAASWFVNADNWDWLPTGRVRLWATPVTGSSQTLDIKANYDVVDSTTRRFHGLFQLGANFSSNDLSYLWLEVTTPAGRTSVVRVTAYTAAMSEQQLGGVDWADLDPYGKQSTADRLGVVESQASLIKTQVINGNFAGGTNEAIAGGGGTTQAIVQTELNAFGCLYARALTTLASLQDSYGLITPDRPNYKSGDFVAVSVLVHTTDWAGLNTGRLRVLCLPASGGGTQVNFALTSYEQISTAVRRYFGVFQLTSALTKLDRVWVEVTANAGRSAAVYWTGLAGAVSTQRPGGVDYLDFDPCQTRGQSLRLSALEAVSPVPAATPGLLIPSSLHLVQGRPLELYRESMTELREANAYDIAAVGLNGNRPSVEYADRILRLDGARFSGAGAVMAKKRGTDTTEVWNRPVTFYSSAPTKAGSPIIHWIADSISYEGVVGAVAAKLTAAGVTPQHVGTYQETGGLLAEARSSWQTAHFTGKLRAANADGTGRIFPVRTGAGSGVTFTPTISGGAVTGIAASGGTGYADCTALPLIIAGGNNNAYATMAITGGVPGAITMVSGGTGYVSAPAITLPPTVAEYNALANSSRWQFNPYTRPATGGDAAGVIFNGYVFDFAFYLARFSLATPTVVFLAQSMNDALRNPGSAAAVQVAEADAVMYASIRAAAPNAHVAFMVMGIGAASTWGTLVGIAKSRMQTYSGREAEKIWFLPAYAAVDPKFVYTLTVSATDPATGVQTAQILDSIHPQSVGRSQIAEMPFALVMNRI